LQLNIRKSLNNHLSICYDRTARRTKGKIDTGVIDERAGLAEYVLVSGSDVQNTIFKIVFYFENTK